MAADELELEDEDESELELEPEEDPELDEEPDELELDEEESSDEEEEEEECFLAKTEPARMAEVKRRAVVTFIVSKKFVLELDPVLLIPSLYIGPFRNIPDSANCR